MTKRTCLCTIAALTPTLAHAGEPQCAPTFTQKITTGGDVTTGNQKFGNAVAIAGNVAVVGEPGDIVNGGTSVGSLSVFRFDGAQWNFEQLLPFPDPGFSGFFAERALDTDGQTIVAGDSNAIVGEDNLIAGAVYVWEYNGATWDFTQKIISPEPNQPEQFGADATIDAGRIFVGAVNYNHPGPPVTGNTGAVLVYIKNEGLWQLDQEVFEDEPTTGADFGHAVCVQGTLMVVSAYKDTATGSVVVFDGSSGDWEQAAKLAPDDLLNFDDFAWRVACIDTLTFAATCPDCNTDVAGGGGAVYVYSGASGTWQQVDKLFDPNGLNDDALGTSIGAHGDTIIAGTPLDDNGAPQTGSASIFRRTDGVWAYEATLNAPGAQPGNVMGNAVAVQGNTALVGVVNDDTAGFNAGAALFYDLACPDDPPPPPGPDLDGSGTVDSTDLNIVLANFGCTEAPCAGDTDGDGDTDSTDLNNILAAFGTMP